jgi:PII-like signaling protein
MILTHWRKKMGKRYYKAELPNARDYIARGGSVLRTTTNGIYHYASFQGNVTGLSFTNKPTGDRNYNVVELTQKEHTALKKEEKALQNMPVVTLIADTQQGVKEILTTNDMKRRLVRNWYYKNIRHWNTCEAIKQAKKIMNKTRRVA